MFDPRFDVTPLGGGAPAPSDALLQSSAAAAFELADPAAVADGTPLARYLQQLLDEAARLGASDLHLDPQPQGLRIRLRIDGQLRQLAQPPRALLQPLLVRVKVLARLDITRTRLPQDGRMRVRANDTPVDIRVSCVPTVHGESLVLRLLQSAPQLPELDQLGYSADQLQALRAALSRAGGLVLVTGPTGSGKTLSLYAWLRWLARDAIHVATAEDPVEIEMPGISQVAIAEAQGFGFAAALRALLRQDPDVLMVGEIRDAETATVAVQAAQTGHLVLSSLHTGDAPSTLPRLTAIGVAPELLAGCLHLVCAQRLLRRLCPRCRSDAGALQPSDQVPGGLPWHWRAGACDDCGGSGYQGRLAVHQLMPVSGALRALIQRHASLAALAAQAGRDGMRSLREAALDAVGAGLTSLSEALAETPP